MDKRKMDAQSGIDIKKVVYLSKSKDCRGEKEMSREAEIKIFSGSSCVEFTNRMCGFLGIQMGKGKKITFSEGNIYVKIEEKVRGEDVYIVQTIGLDPNNEFMELLFWIDAFKRASVSSVTAIIPYFSYAKADKKDEPRVSIRARVCADCLETAGVDRVVTMDLHSPQIQGFFRKPVDHLYANGIFLDYILSNGKFGSFVIVSPDEGFAKNARVYSNKLCVPLAIGSKQRLFHDEQAEILGIIGEVEGKDAIIVDDFAISCGTLCEAARVLKKNGAGRIYAMISHNLLSKKGVERLEGSGIDELITTDTVKNVNTESCGKVTVLTVTELFAKAVGIIHFRESLGEMFK
ncbi:MAG: ribose-phosphate diphosphokinase [Oscillospiraceae bacterium]|jgi:ribose-phosphate pyrophosphokinase|nr:ribose-phosphate diphosphokinase [Oscillospiraceae bacterium]